MKKLNKFNEVKKALINQFKAWAHEALTNKNYKEDLNMSEYEMMLKWSNKLADTKSEHIKQLYEKALTFRSFLSDIIGPYGSADKYQIIQNSFRAMKTLKQI